MYGLLYADDLVFHGESEKAEIDEMFVNVCKRRGLKMNVEESMVIVYGWEERLLCQVIMDGRKLKHISKYSGFVIDESGRDRVDCRKKIVATIRIL